MPWFAAQVRMADSSALWLVMSAAAGASRPEPGARWYDDRMKRITVSLPDDLVERIKRAAGGEGQVSSYVATALADYQEREGLEELLAAWRSETPIADDVRRQVLAELDAVGLAKSTTRRSRQAG
jgi:Arc/MetJ-type ribon-helix-helix transcriptional regulator